MRVSPGYHWVLQSATALFSRQALFNGIDAAVDFHQAHESARMTGYPPSYNIIFYGIGTSFSQRPYIQSDITPHEPTISPLLMGLRPYHNSIQPEFVRQ
jgi:hypothetical protein